MGIAEIITLIVGVISAVAIGVTGAVQSSKNKQSVEETNETNYRIAQETNAANIEQANLAYERSLPFNQVRNLVSAGMSKQGALASLTGGGNYSAPTLQSAQMQAPQTDLSGVSNAFERLGSIPSNVSQANLIEQQKRALQADITTRMNQDAREQQLHEFHMWREQYDKNSAVMLDNASSKIAKSLLDSGKTIEDFKDFESLLRGLKLDKDKDIKNLTFFARSSLENGVRSKFDAERARQQQRNANNESRDRHTLAMDTLKNSESARTLSFYQVRKIDKDLEEADNRITDWENEQDVKAKERLTRGLRADFEKIMLDFGIKREELNNAQWWTKDKDGNIVPTGTALARQGMKDAWAMAGDFFGASLVQDILKGIVMFK